MENLLPQEPSRPEGQIQSFIYNSIEEARALYNSLTPEQQIQMAFVYQSAFGGYPWFERYECPSCNIFSAEPCCPNCNREGLSEAYPILTLVEKDFPKMLSEFSPGVLILATDSSDRIIGFSTGGLITLRELVRIKYSSNPLILNDITAEFGLLADDVVFYDNETCISPQNQRSAIGTQLGAERLRIASKIFQVQNICGRTINQRWLNIKIRQLQEAEYSFEATNLENDAYAVQGAPRVFYVAKR